MKQENLICVLVMFGLIAICACGCFALHEVSSDKRPHGRIQHCYKGRVIYEWDQTSSTANIYIKPPPGLSKTEFEVTIEPPGIRVGRRQKHPFLKEKFFDTVDTNRSSWDLRNGEIQIYLAKKRPGECPVALQHKSGTSPSGTQSQ